MLRYTLCTCWGKLAAASTSLVQAPLPIASQSQCEAEDAVPPVRLHCYGHQGAGGIPASARVPAGHTESSTPGQTLLQPPLQRLPMPLKAPH
jgi:hypothetical protein